MRRRLFIKKLGVATILSSCTTFPLEALTREKWVKLTILHTNDVHSKVEAFTIKGNQIVGGAARRASLIKKIRQEEQHVLLLDAGDIFQGTPYFNFFHGELEFKLMSAMQYDAATIGNHDFDVGIDGLHKQLPHANFPLINCNYDFSDTIMNGKVKPYQIFHKGNLKIGVLGLGIKLEGLVAENLYKNTRYLDPIAHANKYATILKKEEHCDLVICLSHLGYRYKEDIVSDIVLAKHSRHIDLIIGGHTHTFMESAESYKNLDGKEVIINQVGWAGMMLGRL